MKKIKLFALAAFAMLSTNVFAADAYLVKAGFVYRYTVGTESSNAKAPASCTLAGVKEVLVSGNPAPATSYEIPASFDKEFQDETTYYFNVTGCDANWEKAATYDGIKCMAVGDMTSLTLNVDNWAAAAFTGNEYGSLAKLTTLVIADGKKVKTARTVANLQLTAAVKASLTTLDIADVNITVLGNADFKVVAEGAWDKLTTITLPTALTDIGAAADADGVFPGFKGTTISIPSKVTIIGGNAFKGAALTGITFETDDKSKTSLTTIGASAFEGCEALASIALPAEVTSIGNSAFKGCVKLATATVPGELLAATGLGESAFQGCVLLEEIDLSAAKITTLEDNVFKGCEKLATITLPETVATIDAGAFEGTIVATINAPGCTSFNVNALGAASATRAENKTLTTVVLGAPAAATGAYTFANCTALENVTIAFADIANAINANFFYGCTKLAAFKWDATTATKASINNDAFNKCTPNVVISTSNIYVDTYKSAPKFCVYATAAARTFKTVADASGAAAAYGLIYDAANDLAVKAEDAKVYSVYVDAVDAIAYFTALMPSGGKYYVPKGSHCILKTDEPKDEIPVTYEAGGAGVPYDNVFTVTADTPYADFLSASPNGKNADTNGVNNNANFAARGNYLYRLSNNSSFGFSAYKKTLKAGSYFILLTTQPAAGRLQTVWLDENGNVEGDATAINSIVKKAQNAGVTYNLAGQKVNASYKGVVIKDGKKYIQK